MKNEYGKKIVFRNGKWYLVYHLPNKDWVFDITEEELEVLNYA